MSEFQTITLSTDKGVAILTLNQPDTLNSLSWQMCGELCAALATIKVDPAVRCLLLTGSGRGFCSGQNLSDLHVEITQGRVNLRKTMGEMYNPLITAIAELPIPVICAVNGIAAGGGVSIALACDIVVACHSARFAFTYSQTGLIPGAGCTWHLPKTIGLARATAVAMLGESIAAQQAEQWGLIWQCVDDDRLMDESLGLGMHLATQPTKSLSLIKQALRASCQHDLPQHLELEKELQWQASQTADFVEGVTAFIEKRKPVFQGR